jgi:hypothetical protein
LFLTAVPELVAPPMMGPLLRLGIECTCWAAHNAVGLCLMLNSRPMLIELLCCCHKSMALLTTNSLASSDTYEDSKNLSENTWKFIEFILYH